MAKTYDLVIIGSGTAAQVAGAQVREAGWQVAVIDHLPFGGTCQLRGCDPKKILISGAEAIDAAARMRLHGVTGTLHIDWAALMAFKRRFTDPVPRNQEASYAHSGIDALHGVARFAGPDTIVVGDADSGVELKAQHVLIATGARPVPLGIPGEEHVVTSDRFLELETLPRRIVLVGGGYIAAEFSHLAARAGAHVTVLQRGERMLEAFDADLVGWLMEKFSEIGVDVRTQANVTAVQTSADGLVVKASANGHTIAVPADLVVHAAGRVPDLAALDLAAAGVAVEEHRLVLNGFLQSVSNPRVYAAGDAAGQGPALTPVAARDGGTVAANLLEGNRHKPDYRGVPSVAFTLPPIAAVGMTEASAHAAGLKFKVNMEKTADWYTAMRMNETVYGFKTLVERDTGHILGAHLVGPDAQEVINLFALAIRNDLTAQDLQATIFAYPTASSDITYML
jgi:glutathione reductase (NADPH)